VRPERQGATPPRTRRGSHADYRAADLGATGFLLALWAYQAYATDRRFSRYAVVALLMGASVMAKPIGVTLPVVLLLLDVWPLRRVTLGAGGVGAWRPLLVEKLPLRRRAA